MRTSPLAALFAFVPLSVVAGACGGATVTDLATTHDSGSDAVVMGDDVACVDPTEGESCSSTDSACGQEGDPCCIGYVWACDGSTHKWVKEGLGCACTVQSDAGRDVAVDAARNDGGPWTCGTTTKCTAQQYCADHPPGIRFPDGAVPDDAYDCAALPSQCASNPTCACVRAALGNSSSGCMVTSCDEADGHVEVHCIGI